jgi:sugar phosphate isomerase/epimerase
MEDNDPGSQPTNRLLNRRGFLGVMGGAVAGAAMASSLSQLGRSAAAGTGTRTSTGTVTRDKLGIQLWTCLGLYLADMPETLNLIASIGYTYVEYALGFGSVSQSDLSSGRAGGDAKSFRKALDNAGLWCNGGHSNGLWPYNDKTWKQTVHDALIIGQKYLGTNTGFATTKSACMKYVEAVYKGHEVARKMGFHGSLYNHLEDAAWNKLTDAPNKYAVEFVMEHTTPDVWNAEIDTAHALQPLGTINKVLALIRKHPGRFPFLHMKDGTAPVVLPDGTIEDGTGLATEFGIGDFGRPDPANPRERPHAGFQDVLTAIRETQKWSDVLLIAESDGSQATCLDYAQLAYSGLNGLKFPYRSRKY